MNTMQLLQPKCQAQITAKSYILQAGEIKLVGPTGYNDPTRASVGSGVETACRPLQ